MMKKVLLGLAAAGALMSAFVINARAGYKATYPVIVNPTSRYAYGTLSDTRASSDTTSWFGCTAWYYNSATLPSASCGGQDSSGNSFYCNASNANFAAAVNALHGDSYFYMTWDSSGNCTWMEVNQNSDIAPKQP
jgi:hypothetical protein